MKVRWSDDAERDRRNVFRYIEREGPRAAARMDELFQHAGQRAGSFPLAARAGKIPGTRELIPHPNYRLVYELREDTVWILALIHTARQWPPDDA